MASLSTCPPKTGGKSIIRKNQSGPDECHHPLRSGDHDLIEDAATDSQEGTSSKPSEVDSGMVRCTLGEFLASFFRLGTLGFGGPIALAGYMQRDLVESRRWVSKADYVEGLAFSQLSPGPLASQLAMYPGWIRPGFLGATLTAVAFVLPSFLMVLVLASFTWLSKAKHGCRERSTASAQQSSLSSLVAHIRWFG
jgi:hypothetical protein